MKPKLTKKQRQLWLKVKRAILRYPDQFDMGYWFQDKLDFRRDYRLLTPGRCGTAGCIAGWAVALGKYKTTALKEVSGPMEEDNHMTGVDVKCNSVEHLAIKLLGLSKKWDYAGLNPSTRIFNQLYWPEEYKRAYQEAKPNKAGMKQRAKAAADRIDHFLETGL